MEQLSLKHGFRFGRIIIILVILGIAYGTYRFVNFSNHFRKGSSFVENNETDLAITEFEKAAKLNPWSERTFTNLSALYMKKDASDSRSLETARRLTKLKPNSESALIVLADACLNSAKTESVKGNILDAVKLYSETIGSYEKILTINPTPPTEIVKHLGDAFYYSGRYDEGILFFTEKMSGDPDAEKEAGRLIATKEQFLAGSGHNELTGSDTWGPLPFGAEVAVVSHPLLKFNWDTNTIRNGIFYSDLDSDRNQELILIYKMAMDENDKQCYASIFEWINKKWALRWNTKLGGKNIGYFAVEDINMDSITEIVIEGIYDEKSGGVLNIYRWNGSAYVTMQQIGPTWGTTLIDLNGDRIKEIVILDRKRNEYSSKTYMWDGTKYGQIN